ncbi:MAG: hypothetical protein AAF564_21815 [Bacteroidota bacterium]
MINSLSLEPQHSFLANYKIPVVPPGTAPKKSKQPATPLTALQQKMADPRARSLRMILNTGSNMADAEKAELKTGLAVSMWQAGKSEQAIKLADQSLAIFPNQWIAHCIKIEVMMARHKYEAAYAYLMGTKVSSRTAGWDHGLSKKEIHRCAASCQWRLKAWDEVDKHLRIAYPKGVKTMPTGLQEDWFRLALYRRQPDDAAEAAALLAGSNTLEFTDALLQTLVQQGWSGKALPIYRRVYAKQPRNELLRRRLVALCIREGEIEEARKLTESGALNLNP